MPKVDNIIIYKNGNIGDIITIYPAIKLIRLKYPNARIVFLTSPGSKNLISAASILESQNLIDETLYYYDGKIFTKDDNGKISMQSHKFGDVYWSNAVVRGGRTIYN